MTGEPLEWRGRVLEGERLEARVLRSGYLSGAVLSGCVLVDCRFVDCDLSGVRLDEGCTLRAVTWSGCRLTGAVWQARAPLCEELVLEGCDLSLATFSGASLRRASWVDCRGEEPRFEDCDLREARFAGTRLPAARLEGCDLRGADLAGLEGALLDPGRNRVSETRLSLDGARAVLVGMGFRVPDLG